MDEGYESPRTVVTNLLGLADHQRSGDHRLATAALEGAWAGEEGSEVGSERTREWDGWALRRIK